MRMIYSLEDKTKYSYICELLSILGIDNPEMIYHDKYKNYYLAVIAVKWKLVAIIGPINKSSGNTDEFINYLWNKHSVSDRKTAVSIIKSELIDTSKLVDLGCSRGGVIATAMRNCKPITRFLPYPCTLGEIKHLIKLVSSFSEPKEEVRDMYMHTISKARQGIIQTADIVDRIKALDTSKFSFGVDVVEDYMTVTIANYQDPNFIFTTDFFLAIPYTAERVDEFIIMLRNFIAGDIPEEIRLKLNVKLHYEPAQSPIPPEEGLPFASLLLTEKTEMNMFFTDGSARQKEIEKYFMNKNIVCLRGFDFQAREGMVNIYEIIDNSVQFYCSVCAYPNYIDNIMHVIQQDAKEKAKLNITFENCNDMKSHESTIKVTIAGNEAIKEDLNAGITIEEAAARSSPLSERAIYDHLNEKYSSVYVNLEPLNHVFIKFTYKGKTYEATLELPITMNSLDAIVGVDK